MKHLHINEQLPPPAAPAPEVAGTQPATLSGAGRVGKLIRFQNPFSDLFTVEKFHHFEFWCGDASNTWKRFSWGLGMNLVAKSDHSTGNHTYCSYVIQSNDLVFAFTAPYSQEIDQSKTKVPHPGFMADEAKTFFQKRGLGIKAVALLVEDAETAYKIAVENGGIGVLNPVVLGADESSTGVGTMKMAEVKLECGEVVLRLVSNHGFTGPYLPNFQPVKSPPLSYGLQRVDHVAGNVTSLNDSMTYLGNLTGFHLFNEHRAEELQFDVESGLNSFVLANNNEMVLLNINEPVFGTKRKSQIQTYIEHNEGPGIQHLALICDDIFSTLREMRMRTHLGGFDFMPRPPPTYYKQLPERVGSVLTEEQFKECDELGILVDKDEEGVILQIFTQPVGDRPTFFVEIIQRVGCMQQISNNRTVQRGGFGKGNLSALFKSVEEYEKTLGETEEHEV